MAASCRILAPNADASMSELREQFSCLVKGAHLQPGLELLACDFAVPVDVEGLEGCLQVLRLIERRQVQSAGQELLRESIRRTAVGTSHVSLGLLKERSCSVGTTRRARIAAGHELTKFTSVVERANCKHCAPTPRRSCLSAHLIVDGPAVVGVQAPDQVGKLRLRHRRALLPEPNLELVHRDRPAVVLIDALRHVSRRAESQYNSP